MSGETSNEADPEREVTRLHLMLEDWYCGIRADIDPIEAAMAPTFTMLTPSGELQDRSTSLATLTERQHTANDSDPPASLDVSDVTVQRALYGLHQVTYTKELRIDGEWETRTCSLWLRETNSVPSGLQWLHLTETTQPDDDE